MSGLVERGTPQPPPPHKLEPLTSSNKRGKRNRGKTGGGDLKDPSPEEIFSPEDLMTPREADESLSSMLSITGTKMNKGNKVKNLVYMIFSHETYRGNLPANGIGGILVHVSFVSSIKQFLFDCILNKHCFF